MTNQNVQARREFLDAHMIRIAMGSVLSPYLWSRAVQEARQFLDGVETCQEILIEDNLEPMPYAFPAIAMGVLPAQIDHLSMTDNFTVAVKIRAADILAAEVQRLFNVVDVAQVVERLPECQRHFNRFGPTLSDSHVTVSAWQKERRNVRLQDSSTFNSREYISSETYRRDLDQTEITKAHETRWSRAQKEVAS